MQQALDRRIQDGGIRKLIATILASGAGVLTNEYRIVDFPGDDLYAMLRPRGLPIGNLTSQFWANCYLNGFDHFVTRELGCGAYLRYVDDFLLFGDDKAQLWRWRERIVQRLAGLRLTLHARQAVVRPTREGIPFLGFVVYPDHRLLKRRKGILFRRRLYALYAAAQRGEINRAAVTRSLRAWVGHVGHGDTWGLRRSVLAPIRWSRRQPL